MGQVSSTVAGGEPYNVTPRRFGVARFQCGPNEGDVTSVGQQLRPAGVAPLATASFDQPSQRLIASRSDGRPNTFVQDPETGHMLLQVPWLPSFSMRFTLSLATQPPNSGPRHLTFAFASSARELQSVVANRGTDKWVEIGDWPENTAQALERLEFLWVFDPQTDPIGGQAVHFAFFERGEDERPTLICGAALWVSERPRVVDDASAAGLAISGINSGASLLYEYPASPQQPSALASMNPADFGGLLSPVRAKPAMPYGMPLAPQQAPVPAPRPTTEHVAQAEDGPQFRSSLAAMERRIAVLKPRVKTLLKRSIMSRERLQALVEADQWLASGIQEAARTDLTTFRPIVDWFSRSSEGGLSAIQRQRKATLNELTTRIVEPLQQFYEHDIKSFDVRKREFEEDSSQFYSWTSRYLSARKERKERKEPWRRTGSDVDAKFALKKKAFDAARFDYFEYLTDVTSGLKQQVLLQLLALAAQTITDSHIALGTEMQNRTQPRIDEAVEDIKVAARAWEKHRLEMLDRRRALAADVTTASVELENRPHRAGSPEADQPHAPSSANYKEGLLWASNRPGGIQDLQTTQKQPLQNQRWHKYWVVQDGSSLREYTNWKQSVDLHNEPINLLVASVREAKASDRRFCFEIVTPQYKRVYQATSEEDMRTWINSINRSISTLLEGGDDTNNTTFDESFTNSSPPLPSHEDNEVDMPKRGERLESLTRKLSLKSDHRPRVPPIVTALPIANQGPPPIQSAGPDDLIHCVYKIPSDRVCAECATSKSVEWVSINLLMVLCIDCSGAHRSLGAHISKVRSLTLDVGAFTPSLRAAILCVSNAEMNLIWEARLPASRKLVPTSTSQARVKFVSEKYVEKQFVNEIEKPNTALRKAIAERDVQKMCAALAARANANGVSDLDEPMIIHALRSALPTDTTFPTAEVLVVNGATVPPVGKYTGLTSAAEEYLASKQSR